MPAYQGTDVTLNTYMDVKPKKILLADDDPEDQEILEDAIRQLEPVAEMHMVENGKEVLEFLEHCSDRELPELIILDYKMPVLNAVEVLEHINQASRLKSIPKVVWSSSRQPEHVQNCMEKGAASYFVKPNKLSELTKIAEQMLAFCR